MFAVSRTMADRYNHITDNELLAHFYADGNQEWIGALLQRYTLLLLGVCMKYLKDETEARDCVQQIFLKVLTEVPKYKIDYFKSCETSSLQVALEDLQEHNFNWEQLKLMRIKFLSVYGN